MSRVRTAVRCRRGRAYARHTQRGVSRRAAGEGFYTPLTSLPASTGPPAARRLRCAAAGPSARVHHDVHAALPYLPLTTVYT